MLTNYSRLLEYGMARHDVTVEPERVELTLLYFGGILGSMSNLRLYDMDKDKLEVPNVYSMLFLHSGAGKDFARNVYADLFEKHLNGLPLVQRDLATQKTPHGVSTTQFPTKLEKKIPLSYSASISSSDIGLYISALAVMCAKVGSLNIEINEFGDHLGKSENINIMKELYDGEMKAKYIQGDADDEARVHIKGVHANMLAYGSPKGIKEDRAKMKIFRELVGTGLFRRSLIYFSEPRIVERKEAYSVDVSDITTALRLKPLQTILEKETKGWSFKNEHYVLSMSDEAQKYISALSDELLETRNRRLYDELASLDMFAHKLIAKIATVVAYLDLSESVELCHVEYAAGLFKRTRKSVDSLFEETPSFEKIYRTIAMSDKPIMQSDIIKRSGVSSQEFKNDIALVNEIAYRHNRQMKTSTGSDALKKYSLEPLPYTNINEIIVSISAEKNKGKYTIDFIPKKIPFAADNYSLVQLVKASEVDCFTLAHFEPSKKAPNGHREEASFISGQNCIAFDIDYGMTIDEALEKVNGYKYIIYTTKSHTKEAHRFRVLLPTATIFFVDAEQHKLMYENLAKKLGFHVYDQATRNVSRLWYTNESAHVMFNDEGDLLDVRCCLPDTESEHRVRLAETEIDEKNLDTRVDGMYRWFIRNTFKGNRNDHCYRLIKYMKDIGIDPRQHVTYLNSKLDEPLSDRDIEYMLKRN